MNRLSERLAALAAIGAIEGTEGSARLALTDEDKAGRDLVVTWMTDLGLNITVDGIGNVIAVMPGEGAVRTVSLLPVRTLHENLHSILAIRMSPPLDALSCTRTS